MLTFLFMIISSVVLYFLLQYCFSNNDNMLFLKIIEIPLSIAVICVLIYIAIPEYSNYLQQAKNLEALSMASTLKVEATIYYAKNGKWPETIPKVQKSPWQTVQWETGISEADGTIIVSQQDKGEALAFTPLIAQTANEVDIDSVLWLCGYAKASAIYSLSAKGKNHTTIPAKHLPSACVQSRS